MKSDRSGRSRVRVVVIATIIVAVAGYLVLVVAAPALGPAKYSVFAAFWSALYLAVGSIFGIQQEITRQVSASAGGQEVPKRPRVLVSGLLVAGALAVLVVASAPVWAARAFGSDAGLFVVLIALAILLYAGQSVMIGALAGDAKWGSYSAVLIAEAVSRLGFILVAATFVAKVEPFAVASVAAMATWLVFLSAKTPREALLARGADHLTSSLGRLSHSIGGAASSAVLVTGFPLLLALTGHTADRAQMGVVVLVVTLTRAPVLLPMNAFLGMLIGRLSQNRAGRIWEQVKGPAILIVSASAAVAIGGYFLGDPLLRFVFGSTYQSDGWFIAGAALVAGMVGLLSLSGAVAIAAELHSVYLLGWLLAALTSTALLALPISLQPRVLLALAIGPLIGMAVHAVGIRLRRGRT